MIATRTETLLSVQNVGLTLDGNRILAGVNVKVDNLRRDTDGETDKTGQIVAFLAPSGTGKTLMLRIIAGLLKPDTGRVLIGENQQDTRPGMVGLVSQNYLLYRHRTVLGNLLVATRMAGERGFAESIAKDMLRRFGLESKANLYPSQLSGGQRQRVAIGQQLLCSEHMILFDEPTAGLDPIAKENVCQLLMQVANQHGLNTLVIASHDIRAMLAMADTVWLMGRDRDATGAVIPGARIVQEYDLIARGLTWQPDVMHLPAFIETEREILARFREL